MIFYALYIGMLLKVLLPVAVIQITATLQDKAQDKISESIKAGVEYLKKTQKSDGSFGVSLDKNGEAIYEMKKGVAGLVITALVKSGVGKDDAVIKKGLEFLLKDPLINTGKSRGLGDEIYTAAAIAFALSTVDGKEYKQKLEKICQFLSSSQLKGGGWGYSETGKLDISITQFACLGLWACTRSGIKVKLETWKRAADAICDFQSQDGSFTCCASKIKTLSLRITGAGYGALMIAAKHLGIDSGTTLIEDRSMDRIKRALKQSLAFIEKNWTMNDQKWPCAQASFYHHYGIERIAALINSEKIGRKEWYKEGAEYIIKSQQKDGSWENGTKEYSKAISTSLALLFLCKGTKDDVQKSKDTEWSIETPQKPKKK